jgi:predicted dehydrogenase
VSEDIYPGCKTFENYEELFDLNDIDLVVNASYSEMHYPITKDLLLHGKNVLVEKPFGRSRYECDELIKIAKEQGAILAVFQQTFLAPFYQFVYDTMRSGRLGDVKQITIRYNGFSRRWDWQTLQKMLGGNIYNTGPHPIGMALGFLDFDPNAKVAYSKLSTTTQSSGDSDDYAKIILAAPNMPVIDLEINNTDAFCDYTLKVQGSKGTLKMNTQKYKMKYIIDGENPPQPCQESFLQDDKGNPLYCWENFITHDEEGEFDGTAFDTGTAKFYEDMYVALTEKKEVKYPATLVKQIIGVIDRVHAENPLELKY